MHTDVKDQHGQDLEAIIHELGLTEGQVLFSREKVNARDLALMYNKNHGFLYFWRPPRNLQKLV